MNEPYLLMSDQHAHDWSQFASVGADGVNTRLTAILDEIERACGELHAAGGVNVVFAGDLFHTRGSISPEVFNPVYERIALLTKAGFRFFAIPGNHDLSSKETTDLGNAIQTLGELDGFFVATESNHYADPSVVMVPWISKVDEFKAECERVAAVSGHFAASTDLIIHAGIDGVLTGVPGHGLTPEFLAGLGFRRVFAGHYHHHCSFEAGLVWSIGATTHQTFSDIGTKAGFCLVTPSRVIHRASRAPSFVEITGETPDDEVPLVVDGNFVRVRGMKLTDREINELRAGLLEMGAKGVRFDVERITAATRTSSIASPTTTLEQSVEAFIDAGSSPNQTRIKARAAEILRLSREELAA